MKILATRHIREADAYTIENEPIRSVDLMERAAVQLYHKLTERFPKPVSMLIFAGRGNNGGDGIALARMLAENRYPVSLFLLDTGSEYSEDARFNLDRLPQVNWLRVFSIRSTVDFPTVLQEDAVLIDSLFGSGLSRPLEGLSADLINYLNGQSNFRIAIDIPSGLPGDGDPGDSSDAIFQADWTLSLHSAKMAFVVPENGPYVGDWTVLPIGLDAGFVEKLPALARLINHSSLREWMIRRKTYDHKGHFGHALLIAGSLEKMGAAVLSATACLRAGVGLLTCRVPVSGQQVLQAAVPEAMLSLDTDREEVSACPVDPSYQAIGVGPGLGSGKKPAKMLKELIQSYQGPLVLDADALNILAKNPELFDTLPPKTILTPHPGEFKRLFGDFPNQMKRLRAIQQICNKRQLIIVLKGAHTAVVWPDQEIWINTSGNPGMATAGSGDVLTGIVLSLLAQGYSPEKAAVLAVFLHGRAGDLAVGNRGAASLIARDIIRYLGKAFIELN